ncbi:MAG: ABC transporter ATP-binding protein [Spirochaetales bacterium]
MAPSPASVNFLNKQLFSKVFSKVQHLSEPDFSLSCELEVRNLTYYFPNKKVGLLEVNLRLKQGEFVILAGKNGSGKTLLARHLVGLVQPQKGEVLFNGVPLQKCLLKVREKVGFIFQDADTQIIGQTLEEELRFGPENLNLSEDEIRTRVQKVIQLLGLKNHMLTPPARLSGGEKRKLSIGSILTVNPDILILDEPFANLDYPGIVSVLRLLLQLKAEGKGIVLITHELEKALAHADRLVILEEGQIREDGPTFITAPRAGNYGLHPLDFAHMPLEKCTWLPD